MLVLRRREVERLLPMEKAMAAVRRGAAEYSAGYADVPPRPRLRVAEASGEMLVMPGYLPRLGALGLKVVSPFPGNRALGLHPSPGAVLLLDPKTATAAALLDATYLTDVRTGALTGVACEYLARRQARTLAMIGTGAQARTQVDAVVAARPTIEEVRVFSRSPEHVRRFLEETGHRHPHLAVRAAATAREAVAGADVVVAATTATQPVVLQEWIEPGMLVCGVGTHAREAAEIDPLVVARADRIVVDTRRGALQSGELAGPIAAGLFEERQIAELGELVLGRARGRQGDAEIALFKSVGFAAADLAAAVTVLEAAREAGLGQEIDLHELQA